MRHTIKTGISVSKLIVLFDSITTYFMYLFIIALIYEVVLILLECLTSNLTGVNVSGLETNQIKTLQVINNLTLFSRLPCVQTNYILC